MRARLPLLALVAFVLLAIAFPSLADDRYLVRIGTLVFVYWVLITGLNLLVGYAGVLSIGHVGLLAIGGYAFTILAGHHGFHPFLAILAAGAITMISGLLLGLPSLRLPGFYFALSTIAFGLIVVELALGFSDLTGGTVGLSVPRFPAPFRSIEGQYLLAFGLALFATWMTWNVTRLMWGRALIAIRDSDVAARSVAIPVFRAKLTAFAFSGALAGVAGALFARTQSHITPEAFNFDLGLYFFVSIVVGGRGSIVGPFLGALILAVLPDLFGSLQRYSAFFYGATLLAVVLTIPEGIGPVLARRFGRRAETIDHGPIRPDAPRLAAALDGASR